MFDRNNSHEMKTCLILIVLTLGVVALGEWAKPSADEMAAVRAKQEQRLSRVKVECNAAIASRDELKAKRLLAAANAVNVHAVCEPDAVVQQTAAAWLSGLGLLGALLLGVFLGVPLLLLAGRGIG